MDSLLTSPATKIRASSIIKENSAEYKAKNVLDEDMGTCWSSDAGSPQHLLMDFIQPVKIAEIRIMFQGGFAGKNIYNIYSVISLHPSQLSYSCTYIVGIETVCQVGSASCSMQNIATFEVVVLVKDFCINCLLISI